MPLDSAGLGAEIRGMEGVHIVKQGIVGIALGCVLGLCGPVQVRGDDGPGAAGGCCNPVDPPFTCCGMIVKLFLFEQPTGEDTPTQLSPTAFGTVITEVSQMPQGSKVYLEAWAFTPTCSVEGIGTVEVDVDYDSSVLSTSVGQISLSTWWDNFSKGACPTSPAVCFPSGMPGRIEDVGGNLDLDLQILSALWARVWTIEFDVISPPSACNGFVASGNDPTQTICRGIKGSDTVPTFLSWAVPGGDVEIDGDGRPACLDNCPLIPNVNPTAGADCNGDGDTDDPGEEPGGQCDRDGDGVGDDGPNDEFGIPLYRGCDNCQNIVNPGQDDTDGDCPSPLAGANCGDVCEQEACCLPGDVCEDIAVWSCAQRGGTQLGADSLCGDMECADVPAVSQWGTIVMGLLLLTAGTIIFAARGRGAATEA